MLRRFLREPLVHFLVLGGLLFAVLSFVGGGAGVADRKIVVTAADIGRLSQQFLRTWNRPPSAEELQNQIDSYIREEVLYRTALSLGLDKDDFIIRRRLRQKMEFLFEGAIPEPQESDLRAYFHAASNFQPDTVSFRQSGRRQPRQHRRARRARSAADGGRGRQRPWSQHFARAPGSAPRAG